MNHQPLTAIEQLVLNHVPDWPGATVTAITDTLDEVSRPRVQYALSGLYSKRLVEREPDWPFHQQYNYFRSASEQESR